jgi:hypothetical protein
VSDLAGNQAHLIQPEGSSINVSVWKCLNGQLPPQDTHQRAGPKKRTILGNDTRFGFPKGQYRAVGLPPMFDVG